MVILTPHVIQISGIFGTGVWGANVFLLVDDRLTLVDTGFKGRTGQILKHVRQLGFSPSDINRIIITHHHADHIGSLASLKEIVGATVLAHPADAPYIEGRLSHPDPSKTTPFSRLIYILGSRFPPAPTTVDQLLNDGDVLPVLGGLHILHTPGHTLGSICLHLTQERVLIAGDVLAHRFRLGLPSKAFTIDIEQEINSIKRLARLDIDIICFGHGAAIRHNAPRAIAGLVKKLESKR